MAKKIEFNRVGQLKKGKRGMAQYKKFLFFSILPLSLLGIWTGVYFKKKHEKEKKEILESLAQIQYLVEKNQYEEALKGKPGIYLGLDFLSKQPIHDKALANLVNLYTAIVYKDRKHYEKALTHLKRIRAFSSFMWARVKCLEGDIYCETANYDQALACYLEAAKFRSNEFFTPTYLIKAAGVYEKQKAYNKAISCYQKVIDEYPNCYKCTKVKKQLARLVCLKNKS